MVMDIERLAGKGWGAGKEYVTGKEWVWGKERVVAIEGVSFSETEIKDGMPVDAESSMG